MTVTHFWILLSAIALIPIACGFMAFWSCRYYDRWNRREMARRERLLEDGQRDLDRRETAFLEEADARTADLMRQDQELTERRMELERQLHDLGTLASATAHQLRHDDTELMPVVVDDWSTVISPQVEEG